MRILGLMSVRNGETVLNETLDSMSAVCDDIFVLNDRSIDGTLDILRAHPRVSNIFTVPSSLSRDDWFFPESDHYNLLYRMADYYLPDWVMLVDHDEIVKSEQNIRDVLSSLDQSFSGIKVLRVSAWNDPAFPGMIPLLGEGASLQGTIWRHYPGLTPGKKRLHNRKLPNEIDNLGQVALMKNITFEHSGWDTLQKRIDKVRLYQRLDPNNDYNFGVPYDKGLLFGYRLSELDKLLSDYKRLATEESSFREAPV